MLSLKKFKEGIAKHAAVLRRHGLLDPEERIRVPRRYEKKAKGEGTNFGSSFKRQPKEILIPDDDI